MKNKKIKHIRFGEKMAQIDSKYLTYFQRLLTSGPFLARLRKIRKTYSIPVGGFSNYKIDVDENDVGGLINPELFTKKGFKDGVLSFLLDFGFNETWYDTFSMLVTYDTFNPFNYGEAIKILRPSVLKLDLENLTVKRLEQTAPVFLSIPPYASETDIIDYVKKNFKKNIQPILQQTTSPDVTIGKIRKLNPRVTLAKQLAHSLKDEPIAKRTMTINKKLKTSYTQKEVHGFTKKNVI